MAEMMADTMGSYMDWTLWDFIIVCSLGGFFTGLGLRLAGLGRG